MAPSESLSRKIRWIFILQGVVASVLVALGTLVGSYLLRDFLLKQRIVTEIERVWEVVQKDEGGLPRVASGFDSYFVPSGGMPDRVPPALRSLTPGLHVTGDEKWRLAYVSQRAEGTIYIRVGPGLADRVVRWISLLATALSISGIAFISWLGYRRCKRIVTPVSRLTESVLAWDPRRFGAAGFSAPGEGGDSTYEVTHLTEALTSMSRRMEQYVDRERNFTRDASHELRTPVTVIKVAGDLLESETLSPRGERSLRRIRQATGDLEVLIDSFLILARHPEVPLDMEEVDVTEVAHEEVVNAVDWLEGKPVSLRVIESAAPKVQAPPRVLGVILSQLIRNACRFTEQGTIEVEVTGDRVEVRDSGIGMDKETLARAFDPFWRADISDYTAKGMGLTIAQRLAERMGWSLRLESKLGEGTRATLQFA